MEPVEGTPDQVGGESDLDDKLDLDGDGLDDHSDRDLQSRNPWPEPRCPCFRPEAVVEQLEAEEVEAEMALDVLVTSC